MDGAWAVDITVRVGERCGRFCVQGNGPSKGLEATSVAFLAFPRPTEMPSSTARTGLVRYHQAMAHAMHHRFGYDAYLALEQDSGTKHEYLDGQVWAMAGGTPEHARVAGNVLTLLNVQLSGRKCAVFTSDLRLRVAATGLATYPDVSVVCGRLELDPEDRKGHTALNPTVVVEVLSLSTEAYDRGPKLLHYRQIPTLQEIVLVAHDRLEIEVLRRESDGAWSSHISRDREIAQLLSIACSLPVTEVYRDPLAAGGG